ncbi:MAG: AMP-binding protein [Desulfobacterales bacterium]|nr:AMP-binding protein [Desulfobacterales bacterium]
MTTYDDKPWLKSYDSGIEHEIKIPSITFADLFEEGLTAKPYRPAIHFMGNSLTFKNLDIFSQKFSAFLDSKGICQGDVVGINLPNIPQYLIALSGAIRAGCAVTGISALVTPKELAYQLNDSKAKVLVTMDTNFEKNFLVVQNEIPNLKHIIVTNVGEFLPLIKRILGRILKKIPTGKVENIESKHVIGLQEILKNYSPKKINPNIKPEDTCLLQYTGGTTGLPKGTILTHRNLVANVVQARKWVDFQSGTDVACSGFPLFHLAGLILGMMSLSTSNTQCLIPDPRNTDHICKEIARYKPTFIANVPTLFHLLMNNPMFKQLDFSNVRICISGAAPFSVEGIKALESFLGKGSLMEVYGMTETSPLVTMNPYKGIKKIGSVGLPLQSTMVKIVDIQTGLNEVPIGEEGELIIKGPQVMKGYYNKPEETNHALREFKDEKWLYTGDIAKMDEDGYVYIVDRVKDMLNVGGYKVFSREVEDTLYQHPYIELCAIIGALNPERPGSDIVKVVIKLSEEAKAKNIDTVKQEIQEYCKKNMAAYKVPKIFEFTDDIPLTRVGKVDKKILRKTTQT